MSSRDFRRAGGGLSQQDMIEAGVAQPRCPHGLIDVGGVWNERFGSSGEGLERTRAEAGIVKVRRQFSIAA